MQTSNIINDLSACTKVPSKILNELCDKAALCMGSAIHDAKLNNEAVAILNIGIGTLSVELSTMQCKFVPGKDLKSAIKTSLDNGVDPLMLALDKAMIDKLLKIYDEVL